MTVATAFACRNRVSMAVFSLPTPRDLSARGGRTPFSPLGAYRTPVGAQT